MAAFGTESQASASVYNKRIFVTADGLIQRSITIKADVEDAGNPDGVKILRTGLILVPITAAGASKGSYVVYDPAGVDGSQLENDAVVLMNDYEMDGVNPCIAEAAIAGYFIKSAMIVDVAFDYSLAPGTLRFSSNSVR